MAFYSMTRSTSEDAPRGIEFLYSLNRLNVAGKRKTGTGQMSGFVIMTAAANLNNGKYQRTDRSPSNETDECLSCEPYVSD